MENESKEKIEKHVDESWKETVKEEKKKEESPSVPIEVTFGLFISGLMMEALIAMGEIENPATKKKEFNEMHAKFIIDTLALLKDKTRNNLAKDEAEGLESILYDLRMRFVAKTKK